MERSVTKKEMEDMLDNPLWFTDSQGEEVSQERLMLTLQSLDQAIRPPATGAEHLIANELALAVMSQPMDKIRHICEAFMVLSDDEVIAMGMKTLERDIQRAYVLTQTFLRYREDFDYDEYANPREMVKVGFPFTSERAYEFLHPWATKLPFESYPTEGRLSSNNLNNLISEYAQMFEDASALASETGEIPEEIFEEINVFKAKYLYWSFRDGLTHESFNSYVTAFISVTTPKAMQWFRSIMKKVSPRNLAEALSSFSGRSGK